MTEELLKVLKEEIKLLKSEIDILKQQLTDNKKGDDKRHKEIKELQQSQHQDNLKWNKISAIGGIIATPLTVIIPTVIWLINKKQEQKAQKKQISVRVYQGLFLQSQKKVK